MKTKFICCLLVATFFGCQKKGTADLAQLNGSITTVHSDASSFSSMEDVFLSTDYQTLRNALDEGDEDLANSIIVETAVKVNDYLINHYEVDFSEDLVEDPQSVVVAGLFYYGKELGIPDLEEYIPPSEEAAVSFACFKAALGGMFSLPNIYAIYRDFVAGTVGPQTLIRTLRTMGKSIFYGFAIGYAIYELGDCLGWW